MPVHNDKRDPDAEPREPVLDTVERVSEMCFGLFMALTFVGAVSAATAGEDAGRKMMYAALGCNLAWGLVDAVMYLVRTVIIRGERHTLALAVQQDTDPAQAVGRLRGALSRAMRTLVADDELEQIRARIVAAHRLPLQPGLARGDFVGALGIFLIVVLSTFPVALPFVVLDDMHAALIVSRVLSLAMLFGAGVALGRHAGVSAWKAGFGMVSVGVLLTMAVIALGG